MLNFIPAPVKAGMLGAAIAAVAMPFVYQWGRASQRADTAESRLEDYQQAFETERTELSSLSGRISTTLDENTKYRQDVTERFVNFTASIDAALSDTERRITDAMPRLPECDSGPDVIQLWNDAIRASPFAGAGEGGAPVERAGVDRRSPG